MAHTPSRVSIPALVFGSLALACSGGDPGATGSDGGLTGLPGSAGASASSSGTSADGSSSDDGSTAGPGATTGVESATESGTTGGAALTLEIDVADGECVDLSITDRPGFAARFEVHGPPGAEVQLMVAKDGCGVAPFVYQELALDDAGVGVYELVHGGTSDCADSLLGAWSAWALHDGAQSSAAAITLANAGCVGAASCSEAANYCPPEQVPPYIPPDQLFVLTDYERPIFDPPDPGWVEFGMAYEDYPLQNLWNAFDAGAPVVPLDPSAGPSGWYELDGAGSQNHALLWLGVSALGYALAQDVAQFEIAAQNCVLLLELDAEQGHMRHEAVGQYVGFWQGGVAAMALAGLYAPADAPTGPALLEASRAWWADHTAVLRALATPDGQVTLVGARLPGEPGEPDSWMSLSAAINLQLVDPRPHDQLHPTIAQFLTEEGAPLPVDGGVPPRWYRGRHVAERWVVLRAVQTGALLPVPADHPAPASVNEIARWTEGDTLHTACDAVTGYRPARWHITWKPGEVIETQIGDPADHPHQGKGPHAPPLPLMIPDSAEILLGPG